jgi:SAM-dependent methyltransferase
MPVLMPPATRSERLRLLVRAALTASPRVKNLGYAALAGLVRLAARLRQGPEVEGSGRPDPRLVLARTDELNAAAERYFAEYENPEFILGKPYSEEELFPKRLFDLGVLFHALRLSRHDVVLELGAGTCWVSHFLNRYGCKTISVDVSATALRLGRELFARDSQTRWDLGPEFVVYDGHRIPLPAGACHKIVVNDAFHHLPNPEEILGEMARVLAEGGIVAMCEPGPGHSQSADSLREVAATGVLENEIVLGELDAAARAAGFGGACLVPISLAAAREVPVPSPGRPAVGRALLERLTAPPAGPYYLVLHKGPWCPTTRAPGRLAADIEVVAPRGPLAATPGVGLALRVRVVNRGDTRWLATAVESPGWARLGAHLYRATGPPPGELVDFDWFRGPLPRDLEPGEEAIFEAGLPPVEEPGAYRLVFDLVAEQVTWFAERGSPTLDVPLWVGPVGGGDAGRRSA